MNKPISIILIIAGVILIIYGINASNSVGSGFSRMFTGSPTHETLWLLIGGVAAIVIGLTGMLRGPKS